MTLICSDNSASGDRLKALGLVEQTADSWRLVLSFRTDEERYETVVLDVIDDNTLRVRDLLYDIVEVLVADPARLGDPDDPVCGRFLKLDEDGLSNLTPLLEHWEWLDPWVDILEDILGTCSVLDRVRAQDTVVSFGNQLSQQPITAPTGGQHDPREGDCTTVLSLRKAAHPDALRPLAVPLLQILLR